MRGQSGKFIRESAGEESNIESHRDIVSEDDTVDKRIMIKEKSKREQLKYFLCADTSDESDTNYNNDTESESNEVGRETMKKKNQGEK